MQKLGIIFLFTLVSYPLHAQFLPGKYAASNADVIRDLEIKSLADNKFEFRIQVGTERCVGEIEGIATIQSSNIAHFSTTDCESIIFTQVDSDVVVSEVNCFFHGAYCEFAGTYSLETE